MATNIEQLNGMWPQGIFSAHIYAMLDLPKGQARLNITSSGLSEVTWLETHVASIQGYGQQWRGYKPDAVMFPWPETPSLAGQSQVALRVELKRTNVSAIPNYALAWSTGEQLRVSPRYPETELSVLTHQRSFGNNGRWDMYTLGSLSSPAHLPDGFVVDVGLCQLSTEQCQLMASKDGVNIGRVRVDSHAYKLSYAQLFVVFNDVNVSFEYAVEADQTIHIQIRAEGDGNLTDYAVAFVPGFVDERDEHDIWRLPGEVVLDPSQNHVFRATPAGLEPWYATSPSIPYGTPDWLRNATLRRFDSGSVTMAVSRSSGPQADSSAVIAQARKIHMADLAHYGELSEVKKATQAAIQWNMRFSPVQAAPFPPVARGWMPPWPIFDWDNIFAAYMTSLDNKAEAYSQLLTVIRTKTTRGFVPNFFAVSQSKACVSCPCCIARNECVMHAYAAFSLCHVSPLITELRKKHAECARILHACRHLRHPTIAQSPLSALRCCGRCL
eukprot:TRINITY_DN11420_c0_g1_i5.p1 TRINITY_DN11420_c0_g1~~TRINITY_DN11420_c0_g1_i5.p1  ORF type:complete len:560 (+),score=78.03 TRINITY_DN11420_c0_g1_i5:188-1681(+)